MTEQEKTMIRFTNDYNHSAHEAILCKITENAKEGFEGYGEDSWCDRATELIRQKIDREDAEIYYFAGATQANLVVHKAALNSVQAVICPDSGHIYAHEAGSVEATGHKIISLPSENGKITAEQIQEEAAMYFENGEPEYLCEPKMVYISFPTEWGTLYSREELREIREACQKYKMYLFVDGARMGYGLASEKNDVTLRDFAELSDVFYIGGTKCGAMFGEALVILNENLKKNFKTYMKQSGAVLAKGWLLGMQIYTLLKDGLYEKIADQADRYAMELKAAFYEKGIPSYIESYTNQLFMILTKEQAAALSRMCTFQFQKKLPDGREIDRFCTSWSTTRQEIDEMISEIRKL